MGWDLGASLPPLKQANWALWRFSFTYYFCSLFTAFNNIFCGPAMCSCPSLDFSSRQKSTGLLFCSRSFSMTIFSFSLHLLNNLKICLLKESYKEAWIAIHSFPLWTSLWEGASVYCTALKVSNCFEGQAV